MSVHPAHARMVQLVMIRSMATAVYVMQDMMERTVKTVSVFNF